MTKIGIKNAAFRLFAEKGYDATTMNDIAEAVGIKKPSIYVHYLSKRDILNSILQDQYSIVSLRLENILKENRNNDIFSALKMVFLDTVEYFSDRVTLLFWKRMLIGFYSDPVNDGKQPFTNAMEKIEKEIYTAISRLCLEQGSINRNSIDILIQHFYQFISGFMDIMITVPEHEFKQRAELSWHLFCNGVKTI